MSSQKYANGIPSAFSRSANKDVYPVLFQVISPDGITPLIPKAMFLHVNPRNMSLSYTKQIERMQTRGGWVEQHWGDTLATMSLNVASGGFVNVDAGYTTVLRRETVGYDIFENLVNIFHNNGSVYDDLGRVIFKGFIRLSYSGGVYDGHFTSLTITEGAEAPFMFTADLSFTVERESLNLSF